MVEATLRRNVDRGMWNPRSFGSWSRTMTTPMPALKPISTGSEMKSATNPSRRSRSREEDRPDEQRQRGREPRAARRDRPPGQWRRGSAPVRIAIVVVVLTLSTFDDAEEGVDQHREKRRVEADLDRQPRDRGVGHRLRDDDGRGGQAGDDVEPEPVLPVAAEPGGQPGATARLAGRRVHELARSYSDVRGAEAAASGRPSARRPAKTRRPRAARTRPSRPALPGSASCRCSDRAALEPGPARPAGRRG